MVDSDSLYGVFSWKKKISISRSALLNLIWNASERYGDSNLSYEGS